MCDYPCSSPIYKKKCRKLTVLLLDCWQREYDKRPYRNFKFDRLKFEKCLGRKYDQKRDLEVIVSFLTNRFLRTVKLVGFKIPADDKLTLSALVKCLKYLTRIELKLMDLPTEFFQKVALVAENMNVQELSLEGTLLNDEDISELCSFIKKAITLKRLNVASCSINQYNFHQLADAIYKSRNIRSLNISHLLGCHLTFDSEKIVQTLASLVWQNKLQEIILESCGFISQDMEIIAEYLYVRHSKLHSLNVSCNKIGANGTLALLKAISISGTLKHLNMNSCGLGTHGGEVVAQYLSSCWSLETIAITYNNIGAEAINMILLCMKKCCKLRKICVFGNFFNKSTGDILRRLLESGTLPQEVIDVTVTFDDTLPGYRVIPWR